MDTVSGRHPVNIGHLVMGLAFAGLVTVWAILQADVVELSDARWLLPLPWVVAGAVGLAATALPNRRKPSATGAWVGNESTDTEDTAEPAYADASTDTEDTTVLDDLADLADPADSADPADTTDPTEEIR